MNSNIPAPRELIQALSQFGFPPGTDARLQDLMDLNNDGLLNPAQRNELEGLVQLNESISLFRAQAQLLLRNFQSQDA